MRLHSFPRYLWSTQRTRLQVLGGAFLLAAVLLVWGRLNDSWSWFEPLLGVATLIVACYVWLEERREDWYDSLPKRLTVFFATNEAIEPEDQADTPTLLACCYHTYLTHEGDIRNWAQQVGQQMFKQQLGFTPEQIMQRLPPTDDHDGTYLEYRYAIYLTGVKDVLARIAQEAAATPAAVALPTGCIVYVWRRTDGFAKDFIARHNVNDPVIRDWQAFSDVTASQRPPSTKASATVAPRNLHGV